MLNMDNAQAQLTAWNLAMGILAPNSWSVRGQILQVDGTYSQLLDSYILPVTQSIENYNQNFVHPAIVHHQFLFGAYHDKILSLRN